MSEKQDTGTKEYVVVFDQLDAHTGEFQPNGPGSPALAISESYFRGDKVKLDAETAKRHLESGAVIEASDKRAKGIKPNETRSTGVRRDPQVVATILEEVEPPVAGGEGAKRTVGGSLGTKAELGRMKVADLKALAAEHGVEVEKGDDKVKLAAKLAKVRVAAGDQTENPGQGEDQSPPPVDQPDSEPDDDE